jgi:hypothetical protein
MKVARGSLLCVFILGLGTLGALWEAAPVGRLVHSEAEMAAVMGAACYGQETTMKNICSKGEDSDCSGCGCVMEHPVKDEDQGYAAPSVNCDTDPNCKFNFRRGSCKGE